jgi:hypothetical protein
MEPLTPEQITERRRTYIREYWRNRRQNILTENGVSYYDWKQRQKPDYKEKDRIRHRKIYAKKHQYQIFKNAIPHFLTA